ncbi:MAG: DUF5665 domain-containing protein [Patescibacteria group bacterium]|jgi:hypothetical protein
MLSETKPASGGGNELEHEKQLVEDLKKLTESVDKVVKVVQNVESKKYLQMLDNPRKFLFYSFLHGAFIALGSTLGVVIIFTLLAYILKSIEWIPFLGEFGARIEPLLRK